VSAIEKRDSLQRAVDELSDMINVLRDSEDALVSVKRLKEQLSERY
jgi:hypothetical protein